MVTQEILASLPPLRLNRSQLSPDWQAVHDDLKARGFHYAASHMAQMVRYMRPVDYWNRNKVVKK